MPRLLIITGEFPVASETFVVGHIKGMRERGWEIGVAAYKLHEESLTQNFGDDVPPVFELDMRASEIRDKGKFGQRREYRKVFGAGFEDLFATGAGKKQRSRAAALFEVAQDWKPDVMHAHFGPHGLTAVPTAKKLGVPLLVNYRGYDFLNYPKEAGWEGYRSFPPNTVAIGHTRFCEDILREHLDIRVEHVRRGVNRARFEAPERRSEWGDSVKMLLVGRLMYSKGPQVAIDALSLLAKLKPDVHFELTLAGGGDITEELTERAKGLGVAERVKFTGTLTHDEVAKQMRAADIQLIPSMPREDGWIENFCTVASESLASGLTVVASDSGGIPEAIEGAGILVPPGDAEALARGIVEAMETHSPADWSELALKKASEYQDHWMMDDYERVTREAMKAGA